MAFPFQINGKPLDGKPFEVTTGVFVTLPALKYQGATYSRQSVDGTSAGRNQSGAMIRDMIASKDKWQLQFVPCTQEQLGALLREIDSATFQFTYPDPLYGSDVTGHSTPRRTATFYVGDRSAPVYKIEHSGTDRIVELWGNVSFNVIEV